MDPRAPPGSAYHFYNFCGVQGENDSLEKGPTLTMKSSFVFNYFYQKIALDDI